MLWAQLKARLARRENARPTVGVPAAGSVPARVSRSAVFKEMAMTPIESEASDYLEWMEIHNYARLTIECRGRYLDYFIVFARDHEVDESNLLLTALIAYSLNFNPTP